MRPFVSDHSDYYPPSHLRKWLAGQDLPFHIQDLSGESLRYFRSKNPVALFRLDQEKLDSVASWNTEQMQAFLESSRAEGEVKWMISLPGQESDYHLRFILNSEPCEFTVDTLRFNGETWEGSEQARSDYMSGVLRPIEKSELQSGDVLRVAGIAAMLDFDLESSFKDSLREAWNEEEANECTRRFLRKCFQKIVCGGRPSTGFLLLDELGALSWFLPDLAKGKGLSQNRYHKHDIFHHLIYACDAVDEPVLKLRLAALLHDIGKSDTRREQPNGESTFHNHEVVGARIAEKIMRRFGFDATLGKRVRFLVRNHMFHYTSEWSDRAVRRFMQKVSPSQLEDLIALRLADRKGSGKSRALPRAIKDLIRHIDEIRRQESELKIKDLSISGNDLMSMGMKPGPEMGDLLKDLLVRVKSGDLANEREELLEQAQQHLIESTV